MEIQFSLFKQLEFVNLSYYSTCKLIHNKKEQPNYLDYSLFIISMILISSFVQVFLPLSSSYFSSTTWKIKNFK